MFIFLLPGLCEVVKRITLGVNRGELNFGIKVRTILIAYEGMKFGNNYEVLRLCQKYYDLGVIGLDLCTLQPEEGFVGNSYTYFVWLFE